MVGVGVGMFQPSGVALLGDIFYKTRGRAVAMWAMFFGLGLFASPYIIAPFLPLFKEPFVISAIIAVISLVIFYLVIPQTYKKVERVKLSVKGIFNRNTVLLSFSILAYGVSQFGFLSYYSDYLLKVLFYSSGTSALITSMEGLGGFVFAIPLGILADRYGRRYLLILTAFLLFLGTIGIWALTTSEAGLITYTFIYGAGWGMYVDLLVALAQDSVKDSIVGSVSGWMFFIFNIGTLFGGPIFGLLTPFGFRTAGIIGLGIPTAIAFILTLFAKKGTANLIEEKPSFEVV